MRNGKRIAFYCGSLTRGGAERVFANLAEFFSDKGYQVFIVTQYRLEDEYVISKKIQRTISDLTPEEVKKGRITNFVNRYRKLRRILRNIHPDIVFSCNGKNNFMALAAGVFCKRKTVVSVVADPKMEYYTGVMRFLAKTFFACADGIVLQTEQAMKFFPKCIQKKSVILPNSLNPAFLKPRYEGVREKEIVAVGRLDDNKNHAMLCRAFAKLAQDFPDYRVVIYGEGEKRKELEELIAGLQMKDYIFLPGRTEHIEDKIYKSSLFVMTSDTEGMPNAMLEAMSLGLPVISTDCPCGGPGEMIRHGKNGFLIPVRDEEALRKQLYYCLSNPEEMEKVGREAAKLQEKMNPESVNRQWEAYFERVMAGVRKNVDFSNCSNI